MKTMSDDSVTCNRFHQRAHCNAVKVVVLIQIKSGLKRYYEKSRAAKRNKSSADIDWDAVLYTSSMAECPLVILSEEEEETEEDIEEKQRGRGDCEEEEEEKEEGQSQPLAPAKIGVKRKRQHISELCQRQSYRRLDELYALFCETARREEISSARLAGLLLSRSSYHDQRDMAELGRKLFSQESISNQKLSIPGASLLIAEAEIGKSQYIKIGKLLKSEGLDILPNYKDVSGFHKEISPKVKSLPPPFDGVMFELGPVVQLCFERVLETLGDKANELLTKENLNFVIKGGFDGSGGHHIHHQKGSAATNNIIMTMVTPLALKSGEDVLWTEKNPSSADTQRPVALQLGKETIESLKSFAEFSKEVQKLEQEGFRLSVRGKEIDLKVQFRLTELDRKAADSITGLGGAYCDLCFNSKEEAHQASSVCSMKVERTLQSTVDICEKLPSTPDGDVKTKPGDYDQRKGVMRMPSTSKEVESMQVLHMLLRGTDWVLKLTYHEVAGVNHWGEGTNNYDLQFIKNAKLEIQEHLKQVTGIRVAYPDSRGPSSNQIFKNGCNILK